MTIRAPSYPHVNAGGVYQLIGLGSSIYRTTDGITFTRVFAGGADAGQCQAIVSFIDRDSTIFHFAAFSSIAEALTGTARYIRSADNGATWVNGASDKVLHDIFYWDNKLLGAYGRSIIFAVLSGGVEAWNLDDVNDAEFITNVAAGHIHFIGIAQAPWGEPAVYFTDERRLYALDFFARKSYKIDAGIGGLASATCIWNGDIIISDGWNVFVYSPQGETLRNIGFSRKDGIPPNVRGGYVISALIPSDNYLYAMVNAATTTYLYCYNGVGWHQVGAEITGFYSNAGLQASYPPVGVVAERRIHLLGAATTTSTTVLVKNFILPNLHHIPVVGVDNFGASGAAVITGWIDGGFNDIDGTLLRLNIDAFSLSPTSTVRIEYRLDNDENATWIQMVDSANVADVFDNLTSVLYFASASPKRGIKFRTVQFQITLLRSGALTDSPEIKALTLVYLKTPTLRSAWTFDIDVNRMIETGAAGGDTTYYVDGVAATMANVWAKLKTLWTNSHVLLPLIIPNLEPSPGINIKLTDIPLTFDDFRNAVAGKGHLTIQCLEPVTSN